MKIVTLNLRHDANRWKERFPLIIGGLIHLSPDIIAFQEVSDSIHQANLIAEQLNRQLADSSYHVYYERKWRKQDEEGIAILANQNITEYEKLKLPMGGRVAQKVRINQNAKEYILINTHLHHKPKDNEMIRTRQLKALLEWVSDQADKCIIMGDFNAKPFSKTILTLKKIYRSAYEIVHECEPNFTFPTPLISETGDWFEPRTVDYIFYNPAIYDLVDSYLVMNSPDPNNTSLFPSDHYGLYAEIN